MATKTIIRDLSTLGDRLKAERTRLGWSREVMANFGGVSNASQRLYDGSERIPSLMYLLLLTEAGADFNYLLHGDYAVVDTTDFVNVPKASVIKAFRLACEVWNSETGRVSSIDDAELLFASLVEQLDAAESAGMDLDALKRATKTETQSP